jgi:exonuclease SbcD
MRFLHTSDWHIGKPLKTTKRDEEYAAVLAEVLDIAKREKVDCLLVAGDIFDSVAPPPEAERIVFDFLRELISERIPAVIIAGNHDNPRRLSAFARVLDLMNVHVRAEPSVDGGLIVEVPSRDGTETAIVAALPWVPERKVQDFDKLWFGDEKFSQYAQGVSGAMKHLVKSFRPDTVNVLMSHVLLDDSKIADLDRGERALHTGIAYTVPRALLPSEPQYIALGHVHMPQDFELANAFYCGSLLQVDFGEAGQEKRVNIVDLAPGRRARVERVPLQSIRQLCNIGTAKAGVALEDVEHLAAEAGDAYLKVFLKADRPAPGLAQQVREIAPNAVQVETVREATEESEALDFDMHRESPAEVFTAFYRREHAGTEPPTDLMALFNQIYEEVADAAR